MRQRAGLTTRGVLIEISRCLLLQGRADAAREQLAELNTSRTLDDLGISLRSTLESIELQLSIEEDDKNKAELCLQRLEEIIASSIFADIDLAMTLEGVAHTAAGRHPSIAAAAQRLAQVQWRRLNSCGLDYRSSQSRASGSSSGSRVDEA